MAVAAIILAAGESSRLGEPKQLVELGGETLLERAVRVAREAGLSPVFVVLGARAGEIATRCDLRTAQVVRCERWAEGMSRTIATGVNAVNETNAASAVVMTADMPFVTAEHLMALTRKRGDVRASAYAGRHGIPAHFPKRWFPELMRLEGDAGARDLLRDALSVPLSEEDALDIDTPEDLVRARAAHGMQRRLKAGRRK